MNISLIVAADENNGIGKDNQLLCYLPADLKFFKHLTTGHHMLMGRKTYDSIGKPLPNRTSLVITHAMLTIEGCHVFNTIEAGIAFAREHKEPDLFIIGGQSIFAQSIQYADTVHLTRIHHIFMADTFFEELSPSEWTLTRQEPHVADEKNAYNFTFETYQRISNE